MVQTQDPRLAHPALFDLVVAPAHDELAGANVLSITGSPHRITPERLAEAAPAFADRIDPLPHPRVAVLIGGRSKAFDLTRSPRRRRWPTGSPRPSSRGRRIADADLLAPHARGGEGGHDRRGCETCPA